MTRRDEALLTFGNSPFQNDSEWGKQCRYSKRCHRFELDAMKGRKRQVQVLTFPYVSFGVKREIGEVKSGKLYRRLTERAFFLYHSGK